MVETNIPDNGGRDSVAARTHDSNLIPLRGQDPERAAHEPVVTIPIYYGASGLGSSDPFKRATDMLAARNSRVSRTGVTEVIRSAIGGVKTEQVFEASDPQPLLSLREVFRDTEGEITRVHTIRYRRTNTPFLY